MAQVPRLPGRYVFLQFFDISHSRMRVRIGRNCGGIEFVANRTTITAGKKHRGDNLMPANVKPVPEGFHTATPSLVVNDAAKAIEYYKKALGAEERMQMPGPDGRIMHAEIKIGDSIIFLSDEIPGMGGKSPQSVGAY